MNIDKIKGLKKFTDCSMSSNEQERIHKAEVAAYNQAIDDVVKNCSIPNVVKPKGTFCQTPDSCQTSYYQQIGDYYCSKCEKTGLA